MVLENRPPRFVLLTDSFNMFSAKLLGNLALECKKQQLSFKRTLDGALTCPGSFIIRNLEKWSILIGLTRVTSESFFAKNGMKTVLKPRFPTILLKPVVCYQV